MYVDSQHWRIANFFVVKFCPRDWDSYVWVVTFWEKAFDIEKPQFWQGDENVWYKMVERWVDRKDEMAKKIKPSDLKLDW